MKEAKYSKGKLKLGKIRQGELVRVRKNDGSTYVAHGYVTKGQYSLSAFHGNKPVLSHVDDDEKLTPFLNLENKEAIKLDAFARDELERLDDSRPEHPVKVWAREFVQDTSRDVDVVNPNTW